MGFSHLHESFHLIYECLRGDKVALQSCRLLAFCGQLRFNSSRLRLPWMEDRQIIRPIYYVAAFQTHLLRIPVAVQLVLRQRMCFVRVEPSS